MLISIHFKQEIQATMRHKLIKALMAAALLAAFSAVALGQQTYTHKAGGIQFSAPKDWKVSTEDDQLLVSSPDHSISVIFWVVESSSFQEAIEALESDLSKELTEVKTTGDGSEMKLNGFDVFVLEGNGKLDGVVVEFGVMLISAKKPVIVLGMGVPEAMKKRQSEIDGLLGSIRPIK